MAKKEDKKITVIDANVECREKAIAEAIRQIDKKYGEGAIMRLGSAPLKEVDVIPTGALCIDTVSYTHLLFSDLHRVLCRLWDTTTARATANVLLMRLKKVQLSRQLLWLSERRFSRFSQESFL